MSTTPSYGRFSTSFLSVVGLSFICVTLLSSCASTSSTSMAPSEMDVAGFDESGVTEYSATEDALGQDIEPVILSDIGQGLGIELRSEGAEADLVLRSEMANLNYEIEKFSASPETGPAKIRITLPEVSIDGDPSKRALAIGSPVVKEVAYFQQQGSTQVELILAPEQQVAYESEPIAGNLYVRIMPEGQVPALDVAETDTTTQPKMVVAATEAGANPVLTGLRFEELPRYGQVVVAEMQSAGVFSLKRTAPSEYVLRLEDASFEDGEFPTLMAPPSSTAGIRTVRVVKEGNDTLLRIFANPDYQLEATPKNGSIVLRPSDAYLARSGNSDIRAQAELDEALEDGAVELDEGDDEGAGELGDLEGEISAILDEAPKYTGRKISLDLQDTDIDNALRIIAEVSNLNIIASDDVTGKVTLRLIDVPWDQALDVILKTNGLDKVLEGNVMRIAPIEKLRQEREALKQAREAEEELEPLVVKYIRVSYAKAADLRPLVETVLTERGTVTFDDRTNQLIIKDIRRGVRNVAELVSRIDLRTPQVLLETQIVEATRSFSRALGSELGFTYIQSPETGNATGYNFPNSIGIGGSVIPGEPGLGSSFPVAVADTGGSAVSFLLDSADGTRSLDFRLTALEDEGSIRVVSRPSVATTNNQQAVIRSVEKVRIKTPAGGLSVATGAGANASGNGGVATETIEIGIVLEVTPQASPDYFVLLDINAKSSTFGAQVVDDIPSEVERSATSSVLVSSGQTFAMGGIYKISDSDSVSGVPFLKDIPFLGHLFRRQSVDNNDEELIFFITPRIIEGSFDDAAMKLSS